MQQINKYSRNLIITTALYFLVQILFSWQMAPSGKAQLYAFLSALIMAGNAFFIIWLNKKMSDQLLKVFNSYLLVSTFGFYLTYCLKASLIATDPMILRSPFLLELVLLLTLLFNAYQIFIYSREIKKTEKEKGKQKKTLFSEVFSWVDALLSAVIFVLLINIFLVQIYSIPSESMFPVFVVRDRPVVDKLTRGPELPFTRFRIPPLQKINRGDIVTFRNPKYEKTVESEFKHILSQFLYMITFTTVNIDRYDQNGNEKADPLVKRVVGLPGEQIQIINDVVYYRTSSDQEFTVLEENIHSQTDLYELPGNTLKSLQYLPIDEMTRQMLNQWDQRIEEVDGSIEISKILDNYREAQKIRERLLERSLMDVKRGFQSKYDRIGTGDTSIDLGYHPFQKIENIRDDNAWLFYHIDDNQLWERAWGFLTERSDSGEGTFFEVTSKTDLLYKRIISDWIVGNLDYLERVFNNQPVDSTEASIKNSEEQIGQFLNYILGYYDFRNLPPFPAEGTIEEDHYFVMGDNRYNSLDLRHGLKSADRFFVVGEEDSFVHKSYLKPMSIDERWIEGFVVFRLFPMSRMGIPR